MAADGDGDFYRRILDDVYDGIYFVDRDRRITYWSKGAERITGYNAADVVGHFCRDPLLAHMDGEGSPMCGLDRCPAVDAMSAGQPCEAQVYLHHRDGHRVPIVTRVSPMYDGPEVVGAVEVFTDNTSEVAVQQRIEYLEKLALLDPLTGLGNRRHAEMHLQTRLDQVRRYVWPFSLLYFDIDDFKRVNDTYGHEVGDRVLKAVARSTQGGVRSFDIVSRWGGEEFTAIIENVSGDQLGAIAEKVRALVEQSFIVEEGHVVKVTISIGLPRPIPGIPSRRS